MKKQVLTLLVAAAMAAGTIPVYEVCAETETPNVTIYVTPLSGKATAGEEVEFAVSFGKLNGFTGYQMYLDIPDGMTYVPNSVTMNSSFKSELQFDDVSWTEESILLSGYGAEPYTTAGTVELCTFKCVIDDDAASGDYNVTLSVEEVLDNNYDATKYELVPAKVNVVAADVPVAGITVTPTEKTLKTKGETFTVTPTVTPDSATNKKVTFKSSNTSVATVNENGIVTAIANGAAVITATTEDGAKTAECKVTVDIPHVHTMKKIAAKASTCAVQGNNEYYSCEECGKYFKDEAGTTETTPDKEKLALAAHSYTAQNTDSKYLKSEATCTKKAVYYYSCEECGAIGTETFEYGEVDKTNHSGNTKIVGQKEATCDEDGYTGDIVCADCNEVIEQGKVIPAGHTPSDVWSTDSESHWKECTTIGCGNIIDKSAHSGGEANCHAKAVCEVCGVEYGEIDPDNHDGGTEIRNAVAVTEESDGYTGDTYCLGCGKKISDGKVIAKLDYANSKPDDSSKTDNSNSSSAASKSGTASNGGNVTNKSTTNNPNTGVGTASLAAGVISLGALIVTKKKK